MHAHITECNERDVERLRDGFKHERSFAIVRISESTDTERKSVAPEECTQHARRFEVRFIGKRWWKQYRKEAT